jgi:predicted nucleic acid-binding protein
LKVLLLDANSIMLLTRAGGIPEPDEETVIASTGIAAYELGNAVWKDLNLFKKLTLEEAELLLTVFHQTLLRIRIEPQLDISERLEVLRNAAVQGISYYDSCYLTSAIRLKATLVTEDKKLRKAARERGIPTSSTSELVQT